MAENVKIVDRDVITEMIGKLSEEDLVFLNRTIIERLKLISQAKSTSMMARFNIGNRVKFQTPDGKKQDRRYCPAQQKNRIDPYR